MLVSRADHCACSYLLIVSAAALITRWARARHGDEVVMIFKNDEVQGCQLVL